MGLLEIIKNYKLIIWDFDGTIVNLHINWNKLKKEVADILSFDQEDNLSLNELIYCGEDFVSREYIFDIIKEYELRAGYSVNDGVLNMILYFYRNNLKQCIFSDNLYETIKRILSNLQIFDIFDLIISKESVKRFKPDSEGLKKILKHYDLERDKILFVGDSWKDEIVAKNESIKFIFVERLENNYEKLFR